MKESTLVSMQRDIETLKKVATNAIKQLDYQQGVLGGIIAALGEMPEYAKALEVVVNKAKEELEGDKPPTELE